MFCFICTVQTQLPRPIIEPEGKFFELTMRNRNTTIWIPDAGTDKEQTIFKVYMNMTQHKKYAVIIVHSYEQVVLNFTINGDYNISFELLTQFLSRCLCLFHLEFVVCVCVRN